MHVLWVLSPIEWPTALQLLCNKSKLHVTALCHQCWYTITLKLLWLWFPCVIKPVALYHQFLLTHLTITHIKNSLKLIGQCSYWCQQRTKKAKKCNHFKSAVKTHTFTLGMRYNIIPLEYLQKKFCKYSNVLPYELELDSIQELWNVIANFLAENILPKKYSVMRT